MQHRDAKKGLSWLRLVFGKKGKMNTTEPKKYKSPVTEKLYKNSTGETINKPRRITTSLENTYIWLPLAPCRFPVGSRWLLLASFCLPLALWLPFWLPLAPFWFPLASLWHPLAPLWLPLVLRWLPLASFVSLLSTLGPLTPFWVPLAPFWSPLACLWHPLTPLLASFGSVLVPFGSLWYNNNFLERSSGVGGARVVVVGEGRWWV